MGQWHLILIHIVVKQTWVKDWPSIKTLYIELWNLIHVLIIYRNSTWSQKCFRSFNLTTLFSRGCRIYHHASLSSFGKEVELITLHHKIICFTIIINIFLILIKVIYFLIIFFLILIHIFNVVLRKCGTYLFTTDLLLFCIMLTQSSILLVRTDFMVIRMSSEFSVFNTKWHCGIETNIFVDIIISSTIITWFIFYIKGALLNFNFFLRLRIINQIFRPTREYVLANFLLRENVTSATSSFKCVGLTKSKEIKHCLSIQLLTKITKHVIILFNFIDIWEASLAYSSLWNLWSNSVVLHSNRVDV